MHNYEIDNFMIKPVIGQNPRCIVVSILLALSVAERLPVKTGKSAEIANGIECMCQNPLGISDGLATS